MKQFESDHYIFHYGEETKAERDIQSIADCQENCFRFICDVLGITPEFRIEYYLCDSAEEVGRNDPCNAFASPPDTVYAVYNEHIQCIGFHEDSHLISYIINRPDCPAVREGLAMYFDRKWWGIQNMDWAGYYLKTDRFILKFAKSSCKFIDLHAQLSPRSYQLQRSPNGQPFLLLLYHFHFLLCRSAPSFLKGTIL